VEGRDLALAELVLAVAECLVVGGEQCAIDHVGLLIGGLRRIPAEHVGRAHRGEGWLIRKISLLRTANTWPLVAAVHPPGPVHCWAFENTILRAVV
jgi:phage terminase large subunit-like protein